MSDVIQLLGLLLILWVIYWGVGVFVGGVPQRIVGIICLIVFIVRGLQILGLSI